MPIRVLLVDDDVDAVEPLAVLLQLDGHETEVVRNGLDALDAARRVLPDLVILDISLPGLDGYQVAAQIRQEAPLAHTLLVALTGWGDDDHRHAALDAGFDVHLVKPVAWKAIRELVARAGPMPRR